MTILITGAAGFIGSHVSAEFLRLGHEIVAVDCLSDYYSVELKKMRFTNLVGSQIPLITMDLSNQYDVQSMFERYKPTTVIHLAAQAGVRLAGREVDRYFNSNIQGHYSVLRASILNGVEEFFYASSSSVYGNAHSKVFAEEDSNLNPISFYGVSKLFDESITSLLIQGTMTKAIGLRFFTVYGRWGRPDMAYFRIATSLTNRSTFSLFGDGNIMRDFTHISDVVQSIIHLKKNIHGISRGSSEIFNIGGGRPTSLKDLILGLEKLLSSTLKIRQFPSNPNDVRFTNADFTKLQNFTGFFPRVKLQEGLEEIAPWFLSSNVRGKLEQWVNSTS